MSHEARPISPARFASALEDLPLTNLYSKASEIRNSISHLQRSNQELQAYSESQDGGDADCLEAVRENEAVIERMRERVGLVKKEVERRGGRWHEANADVDGINVEGKDGTVSESGHANGVMQDDPETDEDVVQAHGSTQVLHQERGDDGAPRQAGGRLDDEELQRRILERLGEDDDAGMHL